jgi:hypothetical protein
MAGIRTENKIYEVGIYCRLSKDDGTDNESASIATQKSILTDYVKRQGWHLAKTYVDDGYSGTNFQRPSFQNMIKDIENGLINCVITKDLSRLGRNYLDCGLYLEVFFPEHNVRYIAVNDGVDTLNKNRWTERGVIHVIVPSPLRPIVPSNVDTVKHLAAGTLEEQNSLTLFEHIG